MSLVLFYSCSLVSSSIADLYKARNDTVTHELIHAYTLNYCNQNQINILIQYKDLDEFLTEFLSRKSQKFLLDDIITINTNNKIDSSLGYPHFNSLIKELDNTPLINTLIDIKVNNDYENLEKKIDKETLSLLTFCLEHPSNTSKYNQLIYKIKNIK